MNDLGYCYNIFKLFGNATKIIQSSNILSVAMIYLYKKEFISKEN